MLSCNIGNHIMKRQSERYIITCINGYIRRFPDTSPTDISKTDSSPTDTSLTDISPTRHIPDGHFPDQTHPRRTFPEPDTSLTDISPARHIPDGHFSDQTNARQIFAWVDASHNRHFSDRLNTSNNLLRQTKGKYFNNINVKSISDNKKF